MDEYIDLAGCAEITEQNIGSYIGAFEVMIDNMFDRNGGKVDMDIVMGNFNE